MIMNGPKEPLETNQNHPPPPPLYLPFLKSLVGIIDSFHTRYTGPPNSEKFDKSRLTRFTLEIGVFAKKEEEDIFALSNIFAFLLAVIKIWRKLAVLNVRSFAENIQIFFYIWRFKLFLLLLDYNKGDILDNTDK